VVGPPMVLVIGLDLYGLQALGDEVSMLSSPIAHA
jgi:hypothetical protein